MNNKFNNYCYNTFTSSTYSIWKERKGDMLSYSVLLIIFGKKEKEICSLIQINSQLRLLANKQRTNTILSNQKLKIISQNEFYSMIIIPCSSNIIDDLGNIF
jgi:hypothetical protein